MPSINWNKLRFDMLRGGVAVKFANRTIKELQQHHNDLYNNSEPDENNNLALTLANQRLGDDATILREVLSKPELKSWLYRYPLTTNMLAPTLGYIFLFFLLDFFILRFFLWSLYASFDYARSQGLSEVPIILKAVSESSMFILAHLFAPIFLISFGIFIKRKSISIGWPMCAIISIAVLGSGWSYSVDWQTGWVMHGWGYSFLGSPEPIDQPLFESLKIASSILLGFLIVYFYRPLEKNSWAY